MRANSAAKLQITQDQVPLRRETWACLYAPRPEQVLRPQPCIPASPNTATAGGIQETNRARACMWILMRVCGWCVHVVVEVEVPVVDQSEVVAIPRNSTPSRLVAAAPVKIARLIQVTLTLAITQCMSSF